MGKMIETARFYHIEDRPAIDWRDNVAAPCYVDLITVSESSGKINLHVEDYSVEGEWTKTDGIFLFWFDDVDKEGHEFTPSMRNGYLHLELSFTDDARTVMEFVLCEIKEDAFDQLFEHEILMDKAEF